MLSFCIYHLFLSVGLCHCKQSTLQKRRRRRSGRNIKSYGKIVYGGDYISGREVAEQGNLQMIVRDVE